jgi:hypothetical protein
MDIKSPVSSYESLTSQFARYPSLWPEASHHSVFRSVFLNMQVPWQFATLEELMRPVDPAEAVPLAYTVLGLPLSDNIKL